MSLSLSPFATFSSHSVTHPVLPYESDRRLQHCLAISHTWTEWREVAEIVAAQAQLSEALHLAQLFGEMLQPGRMSQNVSPKNIQNHAQKKTTHRNPDDLFST